MGVCFMNRIERIKAERDCLDIRGDMERFASEGFGRISQADLERLKWWGLFWRKTEESFMLRLRVPGGALNATQGEAVAEAALLGDECVCLTTRQGIQLRCLDIRAIPAVFQRLESAGLSSQQTGMDNVHNITGCPVAGLDRHELIDATPLLRQVNAMITSKDFSNLPRKFLISISGCLDDCAHAGINDLALTPAVRQQDGFRRVGFNVRVGGMLGPHGGRLAEPLDAFVPPEDVAGLCRAILEIYREHGNREDRSRGRLRFLLDEWGLDRFRTEVERRMGRDLSPAAGEQLYWGASHLGIHAQKQAGLSYIGLSVPAGVLPVPLFREVLRLAQTYGRGEIRLTQSQDIVIPWIPTSRIPALLCERVLDRLPPMSGDLAAGVVCCTGAARCDKGLAETKGRALQIMRELQSRHPWVSELTGSLRIHFSGCPSSCGQHQIADLGLMGRRVKAGGQVAEAYDVYVGGRLGAEPRLAQKVLEAVPPSRLADTLAHLLRALASNGTNYAALLSPGGAIPSPLAAVAK